MDAVIAEFLKWGAQGAIIVVLGLALKSRDTSYREVQEKRLQEAIANTERFLTSLNAGTAAQNAAAAALKGLTDIIQATSLSNKGGRR